MRHEHLNRAALLTLVVAVLLLIARPLVAQGLSQAASQPPTPPPAPSSDKFSGVVFGDYYYFKSDNVAAFSGQQGFWLRRIYFTYDHAFSPAIATRFRLEASSNGKLASPASSITPIIKDAWVRWAYSGKHLVMIGIVPTSTIEFVDGFWGLRHVEKTPIDFYRFDSTRDFGVTLSGPINAGNTLQYSAQVGNESGTTSEIDKHKAVRFALRYVSDPGFVAEGFYAFYSRPLSANRMTLQAFAGYQNPKGRVGLQYLHNTRQPNAGTTNPGITVNVMSGFGVWNIRPKKWSVFGRIDHSDANPDAAGIDYLPLYKSAPFNLTVAGVEYYIHPSVRFSPNVEWVRYGTPVAGAAAPASNDLVFRLTWYLVW